ncbi:MAG: uracil-DNA glycosylase [Gammaproteobacteria bacterium]|nr:uracil-DNA glycosylase [Gammaproteobacteria bacterium]
MNLEEVRRRLYLDALGITRWEPRQHPVSAVPEGLNTDMELAGVSLESPTVPLPSKSPDTTPEVSRAWEALEAEVRLCTKCPLHTTRTQTVFGVGHRQAKWMFIGEAPGADEDRQGEPFVGRAGQLLNAILFALGLKREEVYIANVLKCRPPGNRDPQPEEVAQCEPYLLRQIGLIRPRLIVALGRHAAHSLLKTEAPLGKLRGQQLTYHGTPLFVTYHPAYLLRNPADKRKVWDDLCHARAVMKRMESA